jgi:hypothetical protein
MRALMRYTPKRSLGDETFGPGQGEAATRKPFASTHRLAVLHVLDVRSFPVCIHLARKIRESRPPDKFVKGISRKCAPVIPRKCVKGTVRGPGYREMAHARRPSRGVESGSGRTGHRDQERPDLVGTILKSQADNIIRIQENCTAEIDCSKLMVTCNVRTMTKSIFI